MATEKLPLPRFEIFRVRSLTRNMFFARFRAKNGKIIWRTSEDYTRRIGAVNAIQMTMGASFPVVDYSRSAEISKVSIRKK